MPHRLFHPTTNYYLPIHHPQRGFNQCDQIGRFFKVLTTKFQAKEAQMIGNFLGYFEKLHSCVKSELATFATTFGKNWATFNSIIWSHWFQPNQQKRASSIFKYLGNVLIFSNTFWRADGCPA